MAAEKRLRARSHSCYRATMSGLTPPESDPEEVADIVGEPCVGESGAGKTGAPEAATGRAPTIGSGGAMKDDAEPPGGCTRRPSAIPHQGPTGRRGLGGAGAARRSNAA